MQYFPTDTQLLRVAQVARGSHDVDIRVLIGDGKRHARMVRSNLASRLKILCEAKFPSASQVQINVGFLHTCVVSFFSLCLFAQGRAELLDGDVFLTGPDGDEHFTNITLHEIFKGLALLHKDALPAPQVAFIVMKMVEFLDQAGTIRGSDPAIDSFSAGAVDSADLYRRALTLTVKAEGPHWAMDPTTRTRTCIKIVVDAAVCCLVSLIHIVCVFS